MTSPYKQHLQGYLNLDNEVRIDRAGAESVTGKIVDVHDDACEIQCKGDEAETVRIYFIAYEDIRGISTLEHKTE